MQETLDLKRQAKSKSQNPLIKQRKNRRSETTIEVAVASDKWLGFEEGFGKGEIGEGFSEGEIRDGFGWVWVFRLICWG